MTDPAAGGSTADSAGGSTDGSTDGSTEGAAGGSAVAAGRIVLLLTSPRVAPGILTWPAWSVLREAGVVRTVERDHPQGVALAAADVRLDLLEPATGWPEIARGLVERAAAAGGRPVVWLGGSDGDPGLGEALARELAGNPAGSGIELELLPGSYDLPGARFVDLVRVMDRLRRECPWVRLQDHRSLTRYLVEETYEAVEALESGDAAHTREELGDLLFQVVFHARLAEEAEGVEEAEEAEAGLEERLEGSAGAYGIDDVVGDLTEKLIRRNPHVFGSGTAREVPEIENVWDQLKAEEKRRTSVVEGVPVGLPALALADKLLERVAKGGLELPMPGVPADAPADAPAADPADHAADPGRLGDTLLALVVAAREAGIDPEQALRDAIRRYVRAVRAAEDPGAERE